jgi:FHA domain
MSTRLLALEGGPDILVDKDLIVVGRHPGCDAQLVSMRVSRMHCCLIEVDGAVVVRDLGSTNGVRINGRRAESGRLRPGDELSIAELRYRLVAGCTPEGSHLSPRADVPGPPAIDWPLAHPRKSSVTSRRGGKRWGSRRS